MLIPWPDFEKMGDSIPVIVQDVLTHEVLMLGYTNQECYKEMVETGNAIFYSRSRNTRWKKGETSGDTMEVHNILLDCDSDAILIKVTQNGDGACHTKATSCFFRDGITGKLIGEVPAPTTKDEIKGQMDVSRIGIPFTSSKS